MEGTAFFVHRSTICIHFESILMMLHTDSSENSVCNPFLERFYKNDETP